MVARIEMSSVRAALVQIFNCKVDQDLISTAFALEELETNMETLDLDEFSRIYYR